MITRLTPHTVARYTQIPKTMSEASALQLMFDSQDIAEAWDGTSSTEIRQWLIKNLEILSKEELIYLNQALFRSRVKRDSRLSCLFSEACSPVPLYTFHVPISISQTITGFKGRSLTLYVSSSGSDNQFIISFDRFRQCFGL